MVANHPRPVSMLIRAGANGLEPQYVRRGASEALALLGVLGISTVAVWAGEEPLSVWRSDQRLNNRSSIWLGECHLLEENGFLAMKTGLAVRHFTLVLPDLSGETIYLLKSLMINLG